MEPTLFYVMLFVALVVLSGLRRSTPPSNWPRRKWPQEPGWPRQAGWPPAPPSGEPRRASRGVRQGDDDFAGGEPAPEFDAGVPSGEFDSGGPASVFDSAGPGGEGLQEPADLEGRQGAEDPEGRSLEGNSVEGRSLEGVGPALTPTAPVAAAATAAGAWIQSRGDLVRGVVLAEVLGPCRAHQPRRTVGMRRI